ncbi:MULTISPECIES: cupin domain-containing protein [Dehalobacter]|uniref:Cupin domain-containing protein n=2 Tax=Dehalobacter restrictus TaxID=55583 RepID=A0A857DK86_9FIRM|nr:MULTISPECIES: cupin domain-containing protein [Dehalobacter]AHF10206.1 cupin [Dehalobacter restrictus DSM 9455]MCG1025679.1 helix-turn-helix transcriptional regulator [Dehalobacter sp.]MDJ0306232.1 cupin domain-containing protein [Dehalobacter sp.]OCZ51487.1 cupin [Dehalobacter sp. TeCB1]QHA00795.1 cupin domain-containing protein [Dehalobacter restrictus]
MTDQLKDMGARLLMLRESTGFTPERIAEILDVPVADYLQYETGEKDFSFSFLYNVAGILGVDVLDIISGESPKLSTCCVVRAGGGYEINRRKAYDYKHLAFTFRNKKAEPFMVTVEPNNAIPERHSHDGQEFNYLVSGSMDFFIGEMVYELGEGDSVYFDSSVPHAMKAHGDAPAKFLAIVMK